MLLTLGQLHQHFFVGQDFNSTWTNGEPITRNLEVPVRLWDFLLYLFRQNHRYSFNHIYFGLGRGTPEVAKTRPRERELIKLKKALTEPRKHGQNDFVINRYSGGIWMGSDRGKRKGHVQIHPLIDQQLLTPESGQLPDSEITGLRILIDWYVQEKHGVEQYNRWIIYVGTKPSDSIASHSLNLLRKKYLFPKYIINYCERIPYSIAVSLMESRSWLP
jgi:hypothetical protein